MTTDKNPPDEQTNAAFVDAVRRIERACGALISPREARCAGPLMLDARSLIIDVLMRSLGITRFLASSTFDHPREITDELRNKILTAFGPPGSWGYEELLGKALLDLYRA